MLDPAVRRDFSTLVAAAFADGVLGEEERLLLHRKAAEMGVPERERDDWIAQGQRGQIQVGLPPSQREREELLDALIDIVCADGRVEAPEHHFLARYASQIKLTLPDLRKRIKTRMDLRGTRETRIDPRLRPTPAAPAPAAPASRPPLPPPGPFGPDPGPPGREPSPAPAPAGPIRLDAPKLVDPHVLDVPPVTLQLIRQRISFETDEGACLYVERILGVPREQAEAVITAVLQAFPDLRRPAASSPTRVRR